ncbi:protein of unknown function [Pseudomonas sp. NFACC02]|uniref:DUF1543 domain-containing protein n=1 Tax=Pseudomonas sp. NFACC02 TaxID=1566250 RepID=UPI0008B2A000|nr:DUF1543 domain-containing protein [Pseudomonas sp. NFACC02]SEQ01385.1 protein of unknown function [Pseudomonas sp. NFACC02]
MLFVVLLGGKHPKAKIEVHDIAIVAGDSLDATYAQLRDGWFGTQSGLHIDAWMAVEGVEGWKVELSPLAPRPGSPRLYLINLGGYDARGFGEAHHYLLVVARSKQEAKARGKRHGLAHWGQPHTDAVMDVDDCLPIDRVEGRYVHLIEGEHNGVNQQNAYIVLPAMSRLPI